VKPFTFLARRFVAGDTIEEALEVVKKLNSKGIKATLDYLGEDCSREADAQRSCDEYISLLKKIAEARVDSNVSLKISQLGFGFNEKLARELLERIVDEASQHDNFVRIDMEGSALTQKTLDLFKEMFSTRKNVGIVIQAYLKRSEKDIQELISLKARVRLCKGAYKEPDSVAFPDKKEVNLNYDRLAQMLLKAPLPAFATHDDERIEAVTRVAEKEGVSKDRYEIQMLYGLRPKRWEDLVSKGHSVRVYVPYGTHWFPYFYRRLRERKENLFFVARNFFD
jgi:proline dehydrogenase